MRPLVVDTNLLLLLMVGLADTSFISRHKRTHGYTIAEFELLQVIISRYSDLLLLQSVLTETFNLARQTAEPARTLVTDRIKHLVELSPEIPLPSRSGVQRSEFYRLGLTDSLVLEVCNIAGATLLTDDDDLAIEAEMLGIDALRWKYLV